MIAFCKQRNALVDATLWVLALWVAMWLCVPLRVPLADLAAGFLTLALLVLFFWNLGCVIFSAKYRISHVIIVLVIMATVAGFGFCVSVFDDAQRHWFFSDGLQKYQLDVDKVTRSGILRYLNNPLDDAVGHSGIWGRTNDDGSVTILFDRRGFSRHPYYMYYSGTNVIVNPLASNTVIVRGISCRFLTNRWYEHF